MKSYKMGVFRRGFNTFFTPLIKLGLAPKTNYLLTTVGRRSGLARTNPVSIVFESGRKWLVAPYGSVPWVFNARAAGRVRLSRRGEDREYEIEEVGPEAAAPILKRYVAQAPVVRPYFEAARDSPEEEFAREADRHPVFLLNEV